MGIIQLKNIKKAYPKEEVLKGIDAEVFPGNRIGLVGNNGCGKTTLFKIIIGQILPDEGDVSRMRGLRIAYLSQLPELNENQTVFEAALASHEKLYLMEQRLVALEAKLATSSSDLALIHEVDQSRALYEQAGGYRYQSQTATVLHGLGFLDETFQQPIGKLSGGQKNRLALVKILLQENDLLLLDEPTNFLDIQGIEWLEEYLKASSAAMVIVSHDRYFLNQLVTEIWDLRNGRLRAYPGNYDKFLMLREQEWERQQELFERQQAEIKRQEDFVSRNVYGERHKSAQSRRRKVEKMERLQAPEREQAMKLSITTEDSRTNTIVELRNLSHSYNSNILFQNLNLTIHAREKVAVVGPNGCGKSTLLHLIAQHFAPANGHASLGHKVSVGFYHQELEDLELETTPFDTIKVFMPMSDDVLVRKFLAVFLFQGDDVYKRVADLSGGERSRLALAKLLVQKPNFLVLDEPTNHLDIRSRQALEDALAEFEGTVLFVSHDRYFIDEVAEQILYYYHGRWIHFYGNYSQFQKCKNELLPEIQEESKKREAYKQVTRNISENRTKKKKKFTLEELEAKIIEAETRIQAIQAEWQQTSTYQNSLKVKELKEEYEQLTQQLQELNREWETWSN